MGAKADSPGVEHVHAFRRELSAVFDRTSLPDKRSYLGKLIQVLQALAAEPESVRPRGPDGRPGGIVYLDGTIPTVLVPDLHARMGFLLAVLDHRLPSGTVVLEALNNAEVQIVCVGDGFHAEARAADRWRKAFEEFKEGYRTHKHMDDEMRESLGLMEIVLDLKRRFPLRFHFLKGNHENITNEDGDGNYPFGKFAFEGEMVTAYVRKFYGEEFLQTHSLFEKSLPLLAVGSGFLVSHAEPRRFYPKETIIDYRRHPEVVYDLTWTADEAAEKGSVHRMLASYLGPEAADRALYFGGHRTITGTHNLRADGRYVQLHNPERRLITVVRPGGGIDLETDIVDLDQEQPGSAEGDLGDERSRAAPGG